MIMMLTLALARIMMTDKMNFMIELGIRLFACFVQLIKHSQRKMGRITWCLLKTLMRKLDGVLCNKSMIKFYNKEFKFLKVISLAYQIRRNKFNRQP